MKHVADGIDILDKPYGSTARLACALGDRSLREAFFTHCPGLNVARSPAAVRRECASCLDKEELDVFA